VTAQIFASRQHGPLRPEPPAGAHVRLIVQNDRKTDWHDAEQLTHRMPRHTTGDDTKIKATTTLIILEISLLVLVRSATQNSTNPIC
jgi:hypothetical protein